MFYIGVDGGGTKTRFSLMDEEENIVATVEKGTCHFNQVGFDGLENLLNEGLKELLLKANVKQRDVKRGCLGLAGYGKVKSAIPKIEGIVDRVFKGIEVLLFNDVHIAHAGALAGIDGIVIIAGTGSIGYSLKNGENKRVGGWGYTIGDEGSAYWIGKKAIEYFSKQADGRVAKGRLYDVFREKLELEDDYDLIKYVNEKIKADRGEVARFARICSKAAIDGDINAIDIFNQAGKELSLLINVLAKDFGDNKVVASYIGGVFNSEELILKPLRENIDKGIELVEPKYSPEIGACLLAKYNKNNQ
ncbi:N-acetylglucosamine kinase [Clostridium sp. LP20]|uniref:N-acetylglucosamine kinase n=1 Tax=Clostridium sp. LP20 TaxID=3418665 RepID=UPI003EE71CB1